LQSTSEAVAGLEHSLVWRPSGNLIAGTQRFGFEGGGAGTENRHDVVFFERNGLRHGEFGIRAVDLAGKTKEVGKWGYRIKELSWSSDSNVLAIWVERDEGDIGRFWLFNPNNVLETDLLPFQVQLWSMNNYYWFVSLALSIIPEIQRLL
ncbi:hypothetical protein H0H93_003054, partial [Arthromyces matolae]